MGGNSRASASANRGRPTTRGEIFAVHVRVAPSRDGSPRTAAHVTPPPAARRAHCGVSAATAISIVSPRIPRLRIPRLRSYTHVSTTAPARRNVSSAAPTRIVALASIAEGGAMLQPPHRQKKEMAPQRESECSLIPPPAPNDRRGR
jgi:hypothetical protein